MVRWGMRCVALAGLCGNGRGPGAAGGGGGGGGSVAFLHKATAALGRVPFVRACQGRLPGRRHWARAVVAAAALLSVVAAPSLMYRLYVRSIEMNFFQMHMGGEEMVNSSSCAIPDYDPFDEATRRFIFSWPPVSCGQTQPYLTYVDWDGNIRVNHTGAREIGLGPRDFACSYNEILRQAGTDDRVEYGVENAFHDAEKLRAAHVRARCTLPHGRLIYETGHAWVPPPKPELAQRLKPADPLRPSVLVFGMDSMSRLNTIRQLPKTYALLTDPKGFGATVFTGMTKVGDNTYPNMVTMLTGMAARKKPGVKGKYWGEERAYGFFDDLPLVWKNFSAEGYVTMYAEDLPVYAAFNYMAKGFLREPTDYYMRPFWLAMDAIKNFRSDDDRCYGNFPCYQYLFNYTREFVLKMRDKRYFAFSFLTGYSHDHLNSAQVMDEPVAALLSGLRAAGALDNTLVMVMGDHGNRFDAIRTTVIGRVEERMPFLAVALPPRLAAARPHLQAGLRANQHTLLSWYDVYEMLADVALDNLEAEGRVVRWGQLGTSLFRRVPARSCLDAGVPSEYCVCGRERALPTDDPNVASAARDLVAAVNALVESRSRPKGMCAALELDAVVNAQLLLPNARLARPQGFAATFRVAVRVRPSGAMLEGAMERDAWSPRARLVGDVARINKYGNQSHCVHDKQLRLYCYCVDLLGLPLPTGGPT